MSLPDTFTFMTDDEAPSCGEGHTMTSLQSKSLGSLLVEYFVHGGRVYMQLKTPRWFGDPEPVRLDCDSLLAIRETPITPTAITATVELYGSCHRCQPVLTLLASPPYAWAILREHWPTTEYDLSLVAGRVVGLRPTAHMQNRGQLLDELRADAHYRRDVLDDDDPLARQHYELSEESRR